MRTHSAAEAILQRADLRQANFRVGVVLFSLLFNVFIGVLIGGLLTRAAAQDLTTLDLTQLGGDFSSTRPGRHAIQVTAPAVTDETRRLQQVAGFSLFHRIVTPELGLGPRYINPSCGGCHQQNTKGQVTLATTNLAGLPSTPMVVRVALAGTDSDGSPRDVPGVGEALRDFNISGRRSFNSKLSWQYKTGKYLDGTPYTLRSPKISFSIPGIASQRVKVALLMTPTVIGVGLLDAINAATILAQADPDDLDRDGISGRANWVFNRQTNQLAVGKFGYKASQPTLEQQSAAALLNDMGLTNPLFPGVAAQPDVSTNDLALLTIYQSLAGVPLARDQADPAVVRGKELFQLIGCARCHLASVTTGDSGDERAQQTIHPFTDLLLHDMGVGLASDRGEFLASGREWRTTPLWGLGFVATLGSDRPGEPPRYLHDGRARTIEEAILWHGGEALASQHLFRTLSKVERNNLVAFLRSL